MHAEPQNPGEKLLRAYAQRRRKDAASFRAMPQTTRNMLQSEVARAFTASSKHSPRPTGFWQFWPRIALGGAIVLFSLLGVIFWQFENRTTVNELEVASATEGFSLAPEATEPSDEGERPPLTQTRGTSPAPVAPLSQRVSDSAAPPSASTLAADDNSSGVIAMNYARLDTEARYRRNFNSPPYPGILESFEARVTGSILEIIDADGSIYTGSIQMGGTANSARRANSQENVSSGQTERWISDLDADRKQRPDASEPAAEPSITRVSFRVVGNSKDLNRRIAFEGEFVTAEDSRSNPAKQPSTFASTPTAAESVARSRSITAPPGNGSGVFGVGAASDPSIPEALQIFLKTARVLGSVTIGEKNKLRIEASRISP